MIRITGGYNIGTEVSVILRDDTGHIVEVVARLEYLHGRTTRREREACRMTLPDPQRVIMEVRDLGMGVPVTGLSFPEFATQHDYQTEATP